MPKSSVATCCPEIRPPWNFRPVAQKVCGAGTLGIQAEVFGRVALNLFSVLHQEDLIAHDKGIFLVVEDKDCRHMQGFEVGG